MHLAEHSGQSPDSAERLHQFQHQSSVVSAASVQTVLHLQQLQRQSNGGGSNGSMGGCGDSVHESISSASFHSVQMVAGSSGGGGGVGYGHQQPDRGTQSSPSAASVNYTLANLHHHQHQHQQYQSHHPLPNVFAAQRCSNGAVMYAPSATVCGEDAGISTSTSSLHIDDVADLLHPQYAIITGGRARDGSALITFPDHCNFHLLADGDYAKLIMYLTSVPS